MTPEELKQYLAAMRGANVMAARLVLGGGVELSVTFGLEAPPAESAAPGGWKQPQDPTQVLDGVSDPLDPDPLGLGALDAPMAFDEPEEIPE